MLLPDPDTFLLCFNELIFFVLLEINSLETEPVSHCSCKRMEISIYVYIFNIYISSTTLNNSLMKQLWKIF